MPDPSASGALPNKSPATVSGRPDAGGHGDPDRLHGVVRVFARGGSAMLASFFLQVAAQFLLVVVVTRVLRQGAAGAFLEAVAVFMIISRWGTLGADSGVVRWIPRLRVLGRSGEIRPTIVIAVVPVAIVSTAASVCVYLRADALAGAFFDAAQRGVGAHELRFMAALLPVAVCSGVLVASLRGFGSVGFYALQNAAVAVARPLIVAAVATAGLGTGAVALAWAAPVVATLAFAAVLLGRELRGLDADREGGAPHRPAIARRFWAYSLPRALATVFSVTITWLDVLLVGRFASTSAAAVYAVASRLYIVGSYALQAVGVAAAPQFSELLAANRRDELERLYQIGTWWTMMLSWPFYALMLVFPSTMMRTVFGADYATGGEALAILGFAGLFDVGTGNSQAIVLMSGHSVLYAANTAVAVGINVGLNIWLIPHLGITGAAIAWTASIATANIAALLQARYLIHVRPFGQGYAVVGIAAIGCYLILPLILRSALGSGAAVFLASTAVASIAYAVLLWRARNALELGTLWRAIRVSRWASA